MMKIIAAMTVATAALIVACAPAHARGNSYNIPLPTNPARQTNTGTTPVETQTPPATSGVRAQVAKEVREGRGYPLGNNTDWKLNGCFRIKPQPENLECSFTFVLSGTDDSTLGINKDSKYFMSIISEDGNEWFWKKIAIADSDFLDSIRKKFIVGIPLAVNVRFNYLEKYSKIFYFDIYSSDRVETRMKSVAIDPIK